MEIIKKYLFLLIMLTLFFTKILAAEMLTLYTKDFALLEIKKTNGGICFLIKEKNYADFYNSFLRYESYDKKCFDENKKIIKINNNIYLLSDDSVIKIKKFLEEKK